MSTPEPARAAGIWAPKHVWVTLGAVAMVFLAATQSLAVTTVMPLVSADLDGATLYAVAFAGTLATSVIGMVAVGAWCDRQGPTLPLTTAVALFVAGLLIAGFAPLMEVLVAGRLRDRGGARGARARAGAAARARGRGALIAGRDSAPAAAPPRYTSARPSRQ